MVLQLSDNDKIKIEQAGLKPVEIGQVQSESDYYQGEGEGNGESSENDLKLEAYYNDEADDYKPKNYFPEDLADFLKEKEIPLEYVYGLLFVRDKREIKSVRRLKVERYLEKRRKKTWNRKICYNCRQKVAEERLRIKGKFIKKRRAM